MIPLLSALLLEDERKEKKNQLSHITDTLCIRVAMLSFRGCADFHAAATTLTHSVHIPSNKCG